ncbi:receptor-like protein EIX2 [Prosopis cineraria]|uniref:receptor-like protein EIX2 n=1 Tax=Prosopis cineraria TaxID=364024 RepID=UPI00241053F2|nr:receptor-like protein EIX2 [Prosopis cineraria]
MLSLNLSRNHLSEKIPKEIGAIKNLETLDLSYNKLFGDIPHTISNISFLGCLNVSYNNFTGQILLGTQIQSFDAWSFVGNLELYRDPLPKKCNIKEETHNSKIADGNEDDNFLKSLYLGMGVGFAVGFWGVYGSLFLIRAWRHEFFSGFIIWQINFLLIWSSVSKTMVKHEEQIALEKIVVYGREFNVTSPLAESWIFLYLIVDYKISSLKYLDLSAVDIGSEAKWLQHTGMLPLLSVLRLSGCRLRHFPSLNYVNFTSLVTLDLSDNHINSLLLASFFNVTKDISVLDLGSNNFYGQIPIALFKLPYLKRLSLRYNQLRGSLPDWLDRHEHLQYFDISENLISGPIPSCFGNLSSLVFLDLSRNQLSGNLPISFGQVHSLKYLIIRGNSFMGVLAEKNFANLSRLTYLDLSSTGFKFHFDPNWVPPFQLESLDVSNTSLGPNLPAWLYTQRSLRGLDISTCGIANIDENVFWSIVSRIHSVDLSNNLISGDISDVTLHSSSISLDNNNFTGSLPHISSDVFYVSASNNAFSGSIFPLLCDSNATEVIIIFFGKFSLDLSNWTNLVYLFLERNKFSGSLPNLQQKNLVVIQLRANQFTGNIPSQICSLSTVRVLDLADNMLSGPIPYCLYNIMNSYPTDDIYPIEAANLVSRGRELNYNDAFIVNSIDLSSNNLSGEIPKELFGMTQLWSLNLSRNQLTGKISKEIGSMKNLESLDLSFNKLYGKIPSTISNLSFLAYLNLSYNNFNGEIPLGTQIQSFELWSFVGNLELCGDPLPKICHKKEETDNSKLDEENEDDNYTKSLYLGMGIGFAVGFWGVCGSLFFIR